MPNLYKNEKRENSMHNKFLRAYNPLHPGNKNTSFSTLLDVLDPDPERIAQRQEYLKRIKKDAYKAQSSKKPTKTPKPKGMEMSFEEKLKKTNQWLEKTFPVLFNPSQPCKPLDQHIVRDIKAHYYKNEQTKKHPSDFVIKAALYRYMETPKYLACLVEGTPRYNIKGEISGIV